jgi:two-component system CheB/CheR fusion protein
LISCRNLLIYLEPEVQRRVVSLFHFALRQDGYLMLGTSETIGRAVDQFKTVSRKSKLFRRIGPRRTDLMDLPMLIGIQKERPLTRVPVVAKVAGGFAEMLNGLLLKQFAPAAVLMTRRYEILSLHGPVVRFLEIPSGEPTRDLLAMARPGLAARIRSAVHAAVRLAKPASHDDVMIQREGLSVRCRVTVSPLEESGEAEGLLLVTLEELETAASESSAGTTPPNSRESTLITQLQNELRATSEDLQRSIEELEESNGELRVANEEALSMIEELQSANEERESSREELQSLNEELCTVNSQLQEKIEEIDRTNADMATLLLSAEIAVLLLDDHLCIQQFSEPAARLFNLRRSDVGRPFRDLAQAFHDEWLMADCRRILSGAAAIEREVNTLESGVSDKTAPDQDDVRGRRYLRRILPLQSGHASQRGVVVTLTDISSLVKLDTNARMLSDLVRNSSDAVLLVDAKGQLITWNAGASLLYGYSETEVLKKNLLELTPVERQARLREELQRLRRPGESETFQTQRITKEGHTLDVLSTIVPVTEQRGDNTVLGLKERVADGATLVSSPKEGSTFRSDDQFKVAEELQAILDATADAVITIDQQGIVVRCNRATRRLFGYSPDELIGRPIGLLMPSPEREQHDLYLQRFLKTGVPQVIGKGREIRCLRKDGSVFYGDLAVNPVDHLGLFTGLIRDISERRRLQNEILHAVSEEQRRIGQDLHDSAGQELTGLNYLIQGHVAFLEKVVAQEIPAVEQGESFTRELDVIRKATGVIKTLQQKIRSVIRGLAPVDINGRGLMAALSDLAKGITDVHQVQCTFRCDPPILMHDNQQAMHLYRIAQESVNNAIRHGKATEIRIELERQGDCTVLTVMDNGCGFDSNRSTDSRGFGLHIMGYRASLIGAVLSVDRADKGGTVVSCRLPDSESVLS